MSALDRVTLRGYKFNRQTRAAILWAERQAGFEFSIAQGSFNRGGVSASAGTHDGSSVDFGMAGVSNARRLAALKALKQAGFAAWMRTSADGFEPHIHAIPFGQDKDVSWAAKEQLDSFDQGYNGLANNAKDRTPWRPKTKRKFSFTLNRPVQRGLAKTKPTPHAAPTQEVPVVKELNWPLTPGGDFKRIVKVKEAFDWPNRTEHYGQDLERRVKQWEKNHPEFGPANGSIGPKEYYEILRRQQ